ncbi:MAG: hypothetical protein WCR06_02430 [bacterium]
MNKTMQTVAMLAVAGVVAGSSTVWADDNRDAKPATVKALVAKAKAAGGVARQKELTLTGMVVRHDIKVAGKNRTGFMLVTAAGDRLRLPVAKAGKNANPTGPSSKLADYIGKDVKVIVMGSEQKKGSKTVVRVKQIKAIEKLAPAPAAEAAPVKAA